MDFSACGAWLTNTCKYLKIRVVKQKLTLTVEARAVRHLKRLAARHRTSVSALLENWGQRAAGSASGRALGDRLRGVWAGRAGDSDPRLSFLLRKHAR